MEQDNSQKVLINVDEGGTTYSDGREYENTLVYLNLTGRVTSEKIACSMPTLNLTKEQLTRKFTYSPLKKNKTETMHAVPVKLFDMPDAYKKNAEGTVTLGHEMGVEKALSYDLAKVPETRAMHAVPVKLFDMPDAYKKNAEGAVTLGHEMGVEKALNYDLAKAPEVRVMQAVPVKMFDIPEGYIRRQYKDITISTKLPEQKQLKYGYVDTIEVTDMVSLSIESLRSRIDSCIDILIDAYLPVIGPIEPPIIDVVKTSISQIDYLAMEAPESVDFLQLWNEINGPEALRMDGLLK